MLRETKQRPHSRHHDYTTIYDRFRRCNFFVQLTHSITDPVIRRYAPKYIQLMYFNHDPCSSISRVCRNTTIDISNKDDHFLTQWYYYNRSVIWWKFLLLEYVVIFTKPYHDELCKYEYRATSIFLTLSPWWAHKMNITCTRKYR